MGRPAKAVNMISGTYRKDVLGARLENEKKLKGGAAAIKPPKYLTAVQKRIFRYIVGNLEASGILGSLDVYVLAECSICIDRMQTVEKSMNENGIDPNLVNVKDSYTKAFFRYCNELSLSPQSRAKLANINVQAQAEKNPLLELLADDEQ